MKERIQTSAAPAAIGPYSQAIKVGNTVYTSGAIPLDEKGEFSDDIATQTRQALTNVGAVLAGAGAKMSDVVKVTCFITDMDKSIMICFRSVTWSLNASICLTVLSSILDVVLARALINPGIICSNETPALSNNLKARATFLLWSST